MKQIAKCFAYVTGIAVLMVLLLLIRSFFVSEPQPRPHPLDAVMVGKKLYFMLEKEYEFAGARVIISTGTGPVRDAQELWSSEAAEDTAYIKTRQIEYGQEINGYSSKRGPKELQKNISYAVVISVKNAMLSYGGFTIIDDNKAIMTHRFDPKLPKDHTVIVEKNGKKITVPYSISFDKDGNKVIVSEPVPEK